MLCLPTLLTMVLDPRLFQGDSIWLKPLKFELSLSLYLLSLAFFARHLPSGLIHSRVYRVYAGIVVAAAILEMIWIVAAAAMGTASHFNVSTPIWRMLYPFMGMVAVVLTSASLLFGVLIWRNDSTSLSPATRTAIALGLVLTFFLTVLTASTMASGSGHLVGVPVTGARIPVLGWSTEVGDLRMPHFLATHAMQVIPLMALLVHNRRLSISWLVAGLYTAVTLATFMLSLRGLPLITW